MLQVHNLMEEKVYECVNTLYDQIKKTGASWLTCDCENCRVDAVNYVLNRIPPHYVVSGRGVTHNVELLNEHQLKADIDSLAIEGIRLVSSAKRPFHSEIKKTTEIPSEPVFNFPTLVGTVFDGSTFEPLENVYIDLRLNDKLAEMMDASWANPTQTFSATKGSYSFWPKPIMASQDNENKSFTFTVEISAEGYTPSTYTFSIPLVSERVNRFEPNSVYTIKIQDLFLFKSDIKNPMELFIKQDD